MKSQLRGKVIFFATNNVNKLDEARRVFAEYKIAVGMIRVKTLEIQSENIEEIAEASVTEAFKKCKLPVIVEDAGLFIDALNGFPGPYAAYVHKVIGNKGILKLMEDIENRKAKFQSVIAHHSPELGSPICFKDEVAGRITSEEHQGNSGFGFDPIFEPLNGGRRTFAEMTVEEKNKYSHRARALRKFAEWYKEKC